MNGGAKWIFSLVSVATVVGSNFDIDDDIDNSKAKIGFSSDLRINVKVVNFPELMHKML